MHTFDGQVSEAPPRKLKKIYNLARFWSELEDELLRNSSVALYYGLW